MIIANIITKLKSDLDSNYYYESEFMFDSEVLDMIAPSNELLKIGICPIGKVYYEVFDNNIIEFDYGIAIVEIMGEFTAGRVIFGPENCKPILGLTIIESLGINFDDLKRKCLRLPSYIFKNKLKFDN